MHKIMVVKKSVISNFLKDLLLKLNILAFPSFSKLNYNIFSIFHTGNYAIICFEGKNKLEVGIAMSLENTIVSISKKLDIDLIGFTDGEILSDLKEVLLSRKATEFQEKDIDKRTNPKLSLENCNSIIVLGLSYNNDFEIKKNNSKFGIISRSSWGIDYHIVLKNRIEKLIKELKNRLDFDYKFYVDTGPLVDRELAKNAGLGYYGKNCSIISPYYGSFIFLGYILTSIKLKTNTKILDKQCGDCNLCIQACPTGALEEPYKLNPHKCISHLSQIKDVPLDLRSKMQNKIYGCDTCQNVCPKNKGVIKPNHPEFIPHMSEGLIDIEELFKMSKNDFNNKYGHMAGSWRGHNNLRKNGIINLVNSKDKSNRQIIKHLQDSESKILKEYIDWALIML